MYANTLFELMLLHLERNYSLCPKSDGITLGKAWEFPWVTSSKISFRGDWAQISLLALWAQASF